MNATMKHSKFLLLAALFATVTARAADVDISAAWVRGTVAAQTGSGAFMEISSKQNLTLVGVSTPVAEAELHEMRLEGGVMKMRAAPRLELPAGKTVTLKPGGYHIMLMGLKKPLQPGDKVPLKLTFENAAKQTLSVEVMAEVRPLGSDAPSSHEHHGHMH